MPLFCGGNCIFFAKMHFLFAHIKKILYLCTSFVNYERWEVAESPKKGGKLFFIKLFFFMKKITFSLLAMLLVVTSAMAQISTGEPYVSVIPRTGNRPQQGDWGLYVGASVTQIIDLVQYNQRAASTDPADRSSVYWALPMVNLKYYAANNWELRCGFEFACQTESQKLNLLDDTKKLGTVSSKLESNFTRFLPGFAYHFNTNNILDVYMGAQMPIGWEINMSKESGKDANNNEGFLMTRTGTFVLGGGVFVGLQVFIADLPFAIGIEGGYSGMARFGGLTKTTEVIDNKKQVFVDGQQISSATKTFASWGADAAITFSYYFK